MTFDLKMLLDMLFVNCPAVFTDKASGLNLKPHANLAVSQLKLIKR